MMMVGNVDVKTDERIPALQAYIQEKQQEEHPESTLIAVLHRAQEHFGYLDRNVMQFISEEMGIPTAHIWGVATFYHYFNLKPLGKHVLSVCNGTACFIKGADRIISTLEEDLGIVHGETTEDGLFSLQETRCLGACGIAPVVMVDGRIHGKMTPASMLEMLNKIKKSEETNTEAQPALCGCPEPKEVLK